MVKLNKIYTKAGDKGKTGLVNGKRIFKDNIRIKAYGTVDELKQKMFKFVWLSSYIVWPRITGELHPKEQTKPLERFNLTRFDN